MYYICHVVTHVTNGINWVASLPFTNPLPWPRGIKCLVDAHFTISMEAEGQF